MKNKFLKLLFSFTLSLSMLMIGMPSFAETIELSDKSVLELSSPDSTFERIEIKSAEDLASLASRCDIDSASKGLYVYLSSDIDIPADSFTPIPYFAGIFSGNNHTISGVSCKNTTEPIGLFETVGVGGLIKDLNVKGSLLPTESCSYIGGIVGRNSGTIYNCSFEGVVTGSNYVGGIAGINTLTGVIIASASKGAVRGNSMVGGIVGINNGTIDNCKNTSLINTEYDDGSIDIKNIDVNFSLDLSKLTSQGSNSAAMDCGGICGYSSGIVLSSVNQGEVGYSHTGYNLGGICGRSSGYIYKSTNKAHITGRKDVGGIVGQMEPFLKKTLSESQLYVLNNQLDELQGLMEKTQSDASNCSEAVGKRIDNITKNVSDAQDSASSLTKTAIDEYDEFKNGSAKDKADSAIDSIKDQLSEKSDSLPDKAELKSDAKKTEQELYDSLSEFNSQVKLLNKEAQGYNTLLDDDLKSISSKFDEIQNTIENIENTDFSINDTSTENPELITLGAIRSCINEGSIEGDLNAAGIAGVMGEESSIDPEDEISLKLDTKTHTDYEYKAIIDSCKNVGSIYTKRNYVGGITSRAEIGYIKDCESYGPLTTDGHYAGGIAATASITVRGCFVKNTISASKYVGGIIAEGITESTDGSGSIVADCRSLVQINNAEKFYGAISGTDAGDFDNNIFVSDELTGLGSYSKSGKAYPVSYDELISGEHVPSEFAKLTLSFVAEDTLLSVSEFKYGQSFEASIFPSIPSKKDCYAVWDTEKLEGLKCDTVVTAIYTPYISALTSDITRSNNRPVLYIEGNFTDSQQLTVNESEVACYDVNKELNHSIFNVFFERTLEEQWDVYIPTDNSPSHTLRYLPIDGRKKAPDIFVIENGQWKKLSPTTLGSYLSFDSAGEKVTFASVVTTPIYASWILAITGLSVVIVLIGFISSKARSHKTRKEKKTTEKKQRKPVKKAVLQFVNLVIFFAIVGITVYLTINPGIIRAKAAYLLTYSLSKDDTATYNVSANISINEASSQIDALVSQKETEYGRVALIETNGINFYQNGTRLLLENGKVFDSSLVMPDYGSLFASLLPEIKNSAMESKKVDGGTLHYFTLSGEAAGRILKMALYEHANDILTVDSAKISILSDKLTVKSIEIEGSATLNSKDTIFADCLIKLVPKEDRNEFNIPDLVLRAIEADSEALTITPDMLNLLFAFGHFNLDNPAVCEIKLSEIGGLINLSDSLSWYRTRVRGEWINCVSKNGISLYYSDKGACTAKGISLTDAQQSTVAASSIINLAYDLCMDGSFDVYANEDNMVYRIDLSQEDLTRIISLVAPKLSEMDMKAQGGTLTISVKDNDIENIRLRLNGSARLLLLSRVFTINVDANKVAPNPSVDYSIPSEVINTLMGK